MKRFLIVRTSAIGDVLQTFPVVNYLHKRFPSAKIDWVVEKSIAPLVHAHPLIDRVIEVDTKLWRQSFIRHRKKVKESIRTLREVEYDALFDLQGNTKSGLITAFANAHHKVGYGWKQLPERTNYFATNVHITVSSDRCVRSHYLALLLDYFGDIEAERSTRVPLAISEEEDDRLQTLKNLSFHEPKIMVCFGSRWKNKQLPLDTFTKFLKQIESSLSSSFYFIYGNPQEEREALMLQEAFPENGFAVGDMSLPLWQRFMDAVDLVISVDSAALHLCSTISTPTFSLFGPSSSLCYKPPGEMHTAFQGQCPYGITFVNRCPKLRTCSTGSCLRSRTSDEIYADFERFWSNISKSIASSTS